MRTNLIAFTVVALVGLGDTIASPPASASDCESPVVIRLSEAWLSSQLAESIDEVEPVRTVVLGTQVRGEARTSGEVTVDVQPSDECGKLVIKLVGRTKAITRGFNGPAVIDTTSWTDFEGTVDVTIDPDRGLIAKQPTVVGTTRSRTDAVSSRRRALSRVIKSIAARQADTNRPITDRITLDQTLTRISSRFSTQVSTELEAINRSFDLDELIPSPLLSLLGDRPHVCSSDDAVLIHFSKQGSGRPDLPSGMTGSTAELWIHQSLIQRRMNLAGSTLAKVGGAIALFARTQLPTADGVLSLLGNQVKGFKRIQRQSEWTVIHLDPAG
ncbi:MAG: hypothetical protein HKN47_16245 [Pirellulaceae bacterium]|nr:hypothetical protein [Pirellulaceae bacterium]